MCMVKLRNALSAGCEMEVQDVIATIEKGLHMQCCLSDPLEIVYTAWSVTQALQLNETERAIGKNENVSPKHCCATFSPMETTHSTRTTP